MRASPPSAARSAPSAGSGRATDLGTAPNDRAPFRDVLALVAPHRARLFVLVGAYAASAAAASTYPLLLDLLTTSLVEGASGVERAAVQLGTRLPGSLPKVPIPPRHGLAVALVVLVSVKATASATALWNAARIARDVAAGLRTRARAGLVALGAHRLPFEGTGRLVSRVTADVDDVERALEVAMATALGDALRGAAVAFVLVVVYPQLLGVAALVLVGVVPVIFGLGRTARRAASKAHTRRAELIQRLTETTVAADVVESHGAANAEAHRFETEVDLHRRARLRVDRVRALQRPLTEVLGAGALLATVLWAWRLGPEGGLRPGEVVGFVLGLVLLYEPLKALARSATDLAAGWAAAERVLALGRGAATPSTSAPSGSPSDPGAASVVSSPRSERPEAPGGKPHCPPATPASVVGGIRLEAVSFRYRPDAPWVLQGASLELVRGRIAALVGPSGSGKSTVAALVARLVLPTQGRVLYDGVDAQELPPVDRRRDIAYVGQDVVLFEGTLLDNIRYGRPDATEAQIRAASRRAGVEAFVDRLPRGYATRLGERGAGLSGGERQRVAIARALLVDAPIVVMDEPTSALDSASERVILDALTALAADRIALVVAHRLGLASWAEEVWALHAGRIRRERFRARNPVSEEEQLRSTTPRSHAMAPPWPTSVTKPSS